MISILAGTNGAEGTGSPWSVLLLYAIIIGGLFYFLMIRPQRTRMRRQEELVGSLGVGDEIQTIGGIYGRVEFIDEATAIIQVEGGGRLKIAKRAIAGKVNP
jgi:preprotein translocase subunit YajC